MNLIERAREFALKAHAGQTRKVTKEPMFYHVEEVAMYLKDAGYPDEAVAAGYLHDTVEDTDVTIEDIRNLFGELVAFYVAGHTEDKSKSWEERKQGTIDELKDPETAEVIRAIIIGDRLSNIRGFTKDKKVVGEKLWTYFKRGEKEQEWFYSECLKYMAVGLEKEQIPKFFYEYEKAVYSFFKRSILAKLKENTKYADEFYLEGGVGMTRKELDWLFERAEKAQQYEDLAKVHDYPTILEETDN